jgi:hypothetical protein
MEYPRECNACASIFDGMRARHRGCVFHHRYQINNRTFCGHSVLTWSLDTKEVDVEMVKWFIEYFNINVNDYDDRGRFPINLILLDPTPTRLELAQWLLTKGLHLNPRPVVLPHNYYPSTPFYDFCRYRSFMAVRPNDPPYEERLNNFRIAAQFFIFNGADSSTIRNGEFNKTVCEVTREPYKKILNEVIEEYEYISLPKEPC